MDTGAIYARQRADITAIVEAMAPGDEQRPVPGCPAWTVRDLLSHLAGLPADVVASKLDGAGTDPWTAEQVESRRDRTVAELLAEWAEHAPFVEEHGTSFGSAFVRVAYDVTLHGDDLREALALPLGDTPDHVTILDGLVQGLEGRLKKAGAPAVRLVTATRDVVVGDGEPGTTLTTDDGELARLLGARRTNAQARALDWSADPEPWLPYLPLFGPKPD